MTSGGYPKLIARRNIQKGDELLCVYKNTEETERVRKHKSSKSLAAASEAAFKPGQVRTHRGCGRILMSLRLCPVH